MKIVANNTQKYLAILVFVLCSQFGLFVISLQAEETRSRRHTVELSAHDARLVERALNYFVRAPRADMPNDDDPSLPPVDLNLDEVRRVLCMIREQNKKICDKIEDLQEELSIHDMLMEFDHELICSKIEIVEEELEGHNTTVCSKLEGLEENLEEHNTTVCSKLEGLEENLEEHNTTVCSKLEELQEDLEEHNRTVCSKLEVISEEIESSTFICDTTTIEEQLEVVCSKLEAISEEIESSTFICDTTTIEEQLEVVCSKLEEIESRTDAIGNICETAHEFGSCVDKLCVDESKGSIIRWLKTILWELRGTFPDGTCAEAGFCDPMLPENP